MYAVLLILLFTLLCDSTAAADGQTRPSPSDQQLQFWLQNMVWHHRYSTAEICQVTGLSPEQLQQRLTAFGISDDTRPPRPADRLLLLPYPGGRHPRIGFLDGAIEPQRETKLSAFCPWDDHSYAVLDFPEALWSNLGLTYLAHTHIDTIWSRQGITLPQLEWVANGENGWTSERTLPNGIRIGTTATAHQDHIELMMWLHNGTDKPLSDLRVQNCVMLKAAAGFTQQNNDNKLIRGNYAAARSADGQRWIITAWDPLHRAWANAPCPCLHSDPQFPDCAPGQTQYLRGWFSFYQGSDPDGELARIEATGWKQRPLRHRTANVTGTICDADTGTPLAARLYVQRLDDPQQPFFFATSLNPQSTTVAYKQMTELGWYSGDVHLHRPMAEVPTLLMSEDLNVGLPMNYWVRDSREIPAASGPALSPEPVFVSPTHVILPMNTEYEIFSVAGQSSLADKIRVPEMDPE